jgi:hypothetical protein
MLNRALDSREQSVAERRFVVGGSDGWLQVRRDPGDQRLALPAYLAVEMSRSAAGRDYFTALEGVERGNTFSVLEGHLRSGSPGYRAAAHLRFSIGRKQLSYAGGTVEAITDPDRAIGVGSHPIQIPDFPHANGLVYKGQSPYVTCWFYLGVGNAVQGRNDRYLHTGTDSAGCVTVVPAGWTQLFRYLVLCRSGNGRTVGTLDVVR